MWPRPPIMIAILLLFSAALSACGSSPTLPQNAGGSSSTPTQSNTKQNCLQYVEQQGTSNLSWDEPDWLKNWLKDEHAGDEARLFSNAKSSIADGPGDCVSLIHQYFQPTIAPSPIVQSSNESVFTGQYIQNIPYRTFSYTYNSQIFGNCSGSSPKPVTVYYGVPVILVLGSLDKNGILQPEVTYVEQLLPNSTSREIQLPQSGQPFFAFDEQDEIARHLYYNNNLPQYFNRRGSGSLTIPAHSTAKFQLPLTIDYQAGWGEVTNNGMADLVLSWGLYYEDQNNSNPTNLNPYVSVSQCG